MSDSPAQPLWRALWPAALKVDARERWRAGAAAALGILVTALLCQLLALPLNWTPWLIAPMGASAVLVFAVPSSPLAQPWAVVGGNTASALVGIACAQWIPSLPVAAAVAVGGAILAMFVLRCLHPPGGASALLAVLTQVVSVKYALFPVLTDSVLLVLAGVLINSATGRRYPLRPSVPMPGTDLPRFSAADLDAALVHYNQVIDVSRDDLESLLHYAEAQAFGRRLGDLRCGQVMTRKVVTADYAMPLHEAWLLLREHRIKALPVIDAAGRVLGIVTVADFLRHSDLDAHEGVGRRLRAFLRASTTVTADKPEVVGQIMSRQVRVASAERAVTELLPLFSESGHHHIPIIDASHRLVGILTQSDLVKALHQAIR